jgi:hypothetical protein
MLYTVQNNMIEWSYESEKEYIDPFNDIELSVIITDLDSKQKEIPAFWAGGQTWRVRYASSKMGIHHVRSVCSDASNTSLHGKEECIQIDKYEGDNPLMKHGALEVSKNRRYLQHKDGTPFFWLGDTWWMGFTKRLEWPEDFKTLTADRREKGFTVIQIVAGLYPDMVPFDERGANEAGFPWSTDFSCVNPEYFDKVDRRIAWLVESGLVPCIVGCWGYYIDFAGIEVLKKHWHYLYARYGAYPVVWCMAGEALMPFYGCLSWTGEKKEKYSRLQNDQKANLEYQAWARKGWTELTQYLKSINSYGHPVTIHPTNFGHKMVDDPSLLDIDLLQTGHGSWSSFQGTVKMINEALNHDPKMPVINGEVCYEGIGCSNYADAQRFVFWTGMLSGAAGHTYGADGVWRVNHKDCVFGASPQGVMWGSTDWKDAYLLPGSRQLGIAKKILKQYEWWNFEPHTDWCEPHAENDNHLASYAAGIAGKVRIIYIPFCSAKPIVKNIEKDISYRAFYVNIINGDVYPIGDVTPDENGKWKPEQPVPIFSDILLVMENKKARSYKQK